MILYFSATGNSEHVARRVAAATGDKVMSIERFDAESLRLALAGGPCQLGFVAPVYAWGLPTPMIEFLKTATCRLPLAQRTAGDLIRSMSRRTVRRPANRRSLPAICCASVGSSWTRR